MVQLAGLQQSEINEVNVRAALDELRYSPVRSRREPQLAALQRLVLVDRAVAAPEFPRSSMSRHIALNELLIHAITENYSHHRRLYGLQSPEKSAPYATALDQVAEDAASLNTELMGWSLLYYDYVRVDLDINHEMLAGIIGVTDRTLRRYIGHAVHRMTTLLIQQEREIRTQERQRWLTARLPMPVPLRLFGRADAMERLQRFAENALPRHMQVTGEPGIGKSVLAQEFVRSLIAAEAVEQVVWIDHPRTIMEVRAQLYHHCLYGTQYSDLRGYVARYQTVVVIDNSDYLDDVPLTELLADVGAAIVVLITRSYRPYKGRVCHMPLDALDDTPARRFARYSGETYYNVMLEADDITVILDAAGGNPRQILGEVERFCVNIR